MKMSIRCFAFLPFLCTVLFGAPSKSEFLKAALEGDKNVVEEGLKEKGSEYARLQDKKKNTPLHLAAYSKKGGSKVDIITLLLKYGADVNALNSYFSSPLHIAASNNNLEGMRILLREPAIKVNERNSANLTPLLFAVGNRQLEAMELLLAHPEIDPNMGTSDGLTPLHCAAMWGYQEETKILLMHLRTDPEAKLAYGNFAGATPLHYAAMQAKPETVKILLGQKGGNPNAKVSEGIYEGFTPLHFAVMHHNTLLVFETIKLLIKAGASHKLKTKNGQLPIDLTTVKVIQEFLKNPKSNYTLKKKRQ